MRRAEVRQRLRELIDGRRPGAVLPSERSLSEQFGVSRPTLRAAMAELAHDGLLVREHGRGTFTASPTTVRSLEPVQVRDEAVPPGDPTWLSRVVEFQRCAAGARLGQRMEVSPGTEVVRAVRVRLVEDRPMAIERILLPAVLVPGMTSDDLASGSLYELLRMRYEVVAEEAVQTTEPTVTDSLEAELLGVPEFAPALLFERTTRDVTGRVVEYSRSLYRGDRYRITTRLRFGGTSG
ncbi:GntR family transcriptional regulator [Kutzneria viridogrisea]|uniref:HTH gntR-type domain-containing protein n=2 Tax=Kutzneria TaxID=43356 RepID=W5WB45_9PSEU|nr:GntR family transcriptional regulator [Kutzneria albida]AHH98373.1 hypothetical protein KALB_5011 [Kutzneria albida DSM 43870]MBA8924107.1 GntR family transcriptional regulator [Kutzneria viridogrisea]